MSETDPPATSADRDAVRLRQRSLPNVTILFSDLVGSTSLSGAMLLEEYESMAYHPLHAAWHEIIPAFGGTVVETRGDGAVAIFSWPVPDEDAGRMATLAALALHERLRTLDGRDPGAPQLRLHSGIHSGQVLVRAENNEVKLLGSAVNVAARLADAAKPDEIIVSEETLGPDRGGFVTSEVIELSLKGKERPVAAFRVLDRSPDATKYAARERGKPFVGRRAELRKLDEIVNCATAGGTSFVSVTGPPGVGKSRLISELLARNTSGLQVHRGECDAHLGAEPFQPFIQILRSALKINQEFSRGRIAEAIRQSFGADMLSHSDVLLRLLAPSDATARKPRASLSSIAAAMRALFGELAEGGPLALFIDDWQWADDASRKLLQGLREIAWPGLLVLLTMRSEAAAGPFDDFERLELTPFNDEEAETAIRQALPNADPFLVEDIFTAAGGNALFIEELCHSVAYGQQDFRTHRGSGWLDILIESRFARLPDAQADLLATAAVIGNVIPVWLLKLTTGCDENDPLVRALADDDFIFPGDRPETLRFKHGITREVIYDSVGLRERRALHLRIAEALRQKGCAEGEEELFEALAYHYGAGGDSAATARYAELAGDKAFGAAALDQALRHYRAALDALDRLPVEPETERRWSRVARRYALAGVWDPSTTLLPILERAVERAAARDDRKALALAEHWLGYVHYGLGNSAESIAHNEYALATALPLEDADLEAQIRGTLGQGHWEAGEHARALELLDEAIAAMRHGGRQTHAAPIGFAYSLSCKGWVLADLGRFAEARELFAESVREVEGIEHPIHASILSSFAIACLWQGCIDEAERVAIETQRVSRRVRTFYMYAKTVATEAYIQWLKTGDPKSVARLRESTAWLEEGRREQYVSLNYGWLAEAMAAAGDTRETLRFAARALRRARRRDRLGEPMALRAVARLAAGQSLWERAEHYLARAMAAADTRTSPHEAAATRLCAAEIAFARGERQRALALLGEAEAAFAGMDMRWHVDQAQRLREAAAAR